LYVGDAVVVSVVAIVAIGLTNEMTTAFFSQSCRVPSLILLLFGLSHLYDNNVVAVIVGTVIITTVLCMLLPLFPAVPTLTVMLV
jgi:hypothetical protein